MTDQEVQPEVEIEVPRKPPSLIRRFGCGILLICWFSFILSPCLLVSAAQQGEISISQGELPRQQIRVWLLMEIDQRGLGISSTSQHEINGEQCLQTNVSFILWQGEAEPLAYCECYTRSDTSAPWSLSNMQQGMCTP